MNLSSYHFGKYTVGERSGSIVLLSPAGSTVDWYGAVDHPASLPLAKSHAKERNVEHRHHLASVGVSNLMRDVVDYWVKEAQKPNYCGPLSAVVKMREGMVYTLNLEDEAETRRIMGTFSGLIEAIYLHTAVAGWCGEAKVLGLRSFQNLQSRGHATLQLAMLGLKALLDTHAEYMLRIEDPIFRLEELLKVHDFFAGYADSPVIRADANRAWSDLKDVMEEVVPVETARALFKKYAPGGIDCPV